MFYRYNVNNAMASVVRALSVRARIGITVAVFLSLSAGGLVLSSSASGASGPIFTVMNTSETLPDGVWFRYAPHIADTHKTTGLGIYKNERVQLECYAWGDAVKPYSNRLWYFALNVSRPIAAGVTNEGYLNAHYINDGKNANQIDAGVPQCVSYNRSAATTWALAHAQDPQGSGALCTWFVSQALWAGGLPQTATWQSGTYAATYVDGLVDYLRAHYSVTWANITNNLTTNAVAAAEPGDIVVYNWNDGGTTYDHMALVVDIAAGQYPEVSEWGQLNFHPWDYILRPSSPYVKRGWSWSAMHNEWLQQEHPGMQAFLLHIKGGYFTSLSG